MLLVLLVALAGCGGGSGGGGVAVGEYARIRGMSNLYSGYLAAHKNQTPPNEQAYREYLATKQEELDRLGLTVDDMFTSPRGSQPLQWVYGRRPPSRAGIRYVAYETTPVDQKRLVLGTAGMYELMDDADFRSVFPNTP